MPTNWFFKLHGKIENIRASEKLSYIPIYSWAYMKETNQRQYSRTLEKLAISPIIRHAPKSPEVYDSAWSQLRGMGMSPKNPDEEGSK